LIANTERLRKRLGGFSTNKAIVALMNDDKRWWIEEVLYYYDKTYQYGIETRDKNTTIQLEVGDNESMKDVAIRAIEMADKISNEKISL